MKNEKTIKLICYEKLDFNYNAGFVFDKQH